MSRGLVTLRSEAVTPLQHHFLSIEATADHSAALEQNATVLQEGLNFSTANFKHAN